MHNSEISESSHTCLFAITIAIPSGQKGIVHTHACTEIVWYQGCTGWLQQGSRRFHYEDGDVAVYQPGESHRDECDQGGDQLCFGISAHGAEKIPAGVWHPDERTVSALALLRQETRHRDERSPQRLELLCGLLVLELQRQLGEGGSHETDVPCHVRAAQKILESRFTEPLSITEVASELSIHPDYLRQLFVKKIGETPIHFLIRKRLEAACDLLRLNQETTVRIAERVGIPNPYYFSRLFRNRFGISPTQYRTQYANKKGD